MSLGLSPEQASGLARVPALSPPPGVKPNLVDPYSRQDVIIVVACFVIPLTTLLVALQAFTKHFVSKLGLGIDDCKRKSPGLLMYLLSRLVQIYPFLLKSVLNNTK